MSNNIKGKKDIGETIKKTATDIGKTGAKVASNAGKAGAKVAAQAKNTAIQAKEATIQAIDANGNGEIDIEDIIIQGLKVPGVRINRSSFLKKELRNKYKKDVVELAIALNPAKAGISVEDIDKIADEVIKCERNAVSGISAALGVPGGVAMVATIPVDIIQYYGYMIRAAQKLLYLYGFPEIEVSEDGEILDSATMNSLIVCMGVMYGVAGANKALRVMAQALAGGVEKKLLNTALTKGTIYPIVKSVSKWFQVKMTKEVFAGFFKKAIPVVGGVLGGGITYVSFKPCCERLKKSLRDTMLSDPNKNPDEEDDINEKIIDADCIEVSEEP